MTRDEIRDTTVKRFEECEAKRAEARAAALAEGKSKHEASEAAQEAAKRHWNSWAENMLAKRRALEDSKLWAAEEGYPGLEPRNAETRAWAEEAAADFSRCLVLVREENGAKEVSAKDDEQEESSESPVLSLAIDNTEIDLRGYIFPGYAWFESAILCGDVWFDRATFLGDVWFDRATFLGYALFGSATFSGNASFDRANFSGDTSFGSAVFSGNVSFGSAALLGNASFDRATFKSDASFDRVTFFGDASFRSATLSGNASFGRGAFKGNASFDRITFSGNALFDQANFSGNTWFDSATFEGNAVFDSTTFKGKAIFLAILGKRAFSMAKAVFNTVPDFIQAHFEEAPRLDNLQVIVRIIEPHQNPEGEKGKAQWQAGWVRTLPKRVPPGIWRRVAEADRDIPSRWRALKRLAIQGHDTDRELEFHAREMRAQRFVQDWPLPVKFWSGESWAGFFRFWFGSLYGIASDFGRSLVRPFMFWFVAVVLGAVFYLSQSPDMIEPRAKMEKKGASQISAAFATAWHAWWLHPKSCYAGQTLPPKDKNGDTPSYIGALTPGLQEVTGLANEAWHLAIRNAFILLDGSNEAANRTFGCLYGVEMYAGANPLAVVPSSVSTISAVQKLFSGLMIFLFGLALRNMLKVK